MNTRTPPIALAAAELRRLADIFVAEAAMYAREKREEGDSPFGRFYEGRERGLCDAARSMRNRATRLERGTAGR